MPSTRLKPDVPTLAALIAAAESAIIRYRALPREERDTALGDYRERVDAAEHAIDEACRALAARLHTALESGSAVELVAVSADYRTLPPAARLWFFGLWLEGSAGTAGDVIELLATRGKGITI
jgi:uncharacterized MAPEG superfamily protein